MCGSFMDERSAEEIIREAEHHISDFIHESSVYQSKVRLLTDQMRRLLIELQKETTTPPLSKEVLTPPRLSEIVELYNRWRESHPKEE